MSKTPKAVRVTQAPGQDEVPTEVLASAVTDIAQGIRRLRAGRLNDRALFLLIQHAAPSKVSIADIKAVFTGIDALERTFLQKRART